MILVAESPGHNYSNRVRFSHGINVGEATCIVRIEVEATYFPRITKWHLRRVLKRIGQHDLEGLEFIRVIDECPDDPESAKVPQYLRGFLHNGHYLRKMKNRPAEVVLYANDIYFGIPKLLMASPMATLKVARTLTHEVGHHVIATRGYIYKPWEKYKPWDGIRNPYEEKMADAYASDVMERMLKHWPYKLGKLMLRMLSNVLYQWGLTDYWDGNYQSAASLETRAHSLNPENEDAGQCFRHAMEKLKTQDPSPLSPAEREWLIEKYNPMPMRTGHLLLPKEGAGKRQRRPT
jgi:hypothetical protein